MNQITVNPLSTLYVGDCREVLRSLPEKSVHCVMTSPPYFGLRDYGTAEWEGGEAGCDHKPPDEAGGTGKPTAGQRQHAGRFAGHTCHKCGARRIDSQIGLEPTPDEFVAAMVEVFGEVKRVLRDDGVCWVNLGDSYAANGKCGGGSPVDERKPEYGRLGHESDKSPGRENAGSVTKRVPTGLKPKDLIGVPWRVAFALQAAGWYLRDAVIWAKPSPMPGSQRDRCTSSYEFVFQLTKRARYWFDMENVKEPCQYGPSIWPGGANEAFRTGKKTPEKPQERHNRTNTPGNGGTRIPRNVWRIANTGYAEAHFATYPLELCRIPILSSTSEKGCCSKCGTPRGRVVEKPFKGGGNPHEYERLSVGNKMTMNGAELAKWYRENPGKTLGWEPGCTCNAYIVPCTVLDPFAGSGTTLQFATLHGRRSIGIELNPEYAKLAVKRINTPLEKPGRIESLPGQMSLFEETA